MRRKRIIEFKEKGNNGLAGTVTLDLKEEPVGSNYFMDEFEGMTDRIYEALLKRFNASEISIKKK